MLFMKQNLENRTIFLPQQDTAGLTIRGVTGAGTNREGSKATESPMDRQKDARNSYTVLYHITPGGGSMNTTSFEVSEKFQSESEKERKENFCRIIEHYISEKLEHPTD